MQPGPCATLGLGRSRLPPGLGRLSQHLPERRTLRGGGNGGFPSPAYRPGTGAPWVGGKERVTGLVMPSVCLWVWGRGGEVWGPAHTPGVHRTPHWAALEVVFFRVKLVQFTATFCRVCLAESRQNLQYRKKETYSRNKYRKEHSWEPVLYKYNINVAWLWWNCLWHYLSCSCGIHRMFTQIPTPRDNVLVAAMRILKRTSACENGRCFHSCKEGSIFRHFLPLVEAPSIFMSRFWGVLLQPQRGEEKEISSAYGT